MRALRRYNEELSVPSRVIEYRYMSTQSISENKPRLVMERLTRIEDAGRTFDVEFWQRQGDAAIFAAAWEMVVFANEFKGRDAGELTFQRTLKKIQRASS